MEGSDWSFNLRKFDPNAFLDSESDSEDNTDSNPSSAQDAAETFDLSSREENVTYKPNPFSIAKINAACRARSAQDGGGAALMKSKKLTGPVRPVTTKTVEEKKHAKSVRQASIGQNGAKAPLPQRDMISKATIFQQTARQEPAKARDSFGALITSHESTPTAPVIPSFVQSQAYANGSMRQRVDENMPGPAPDPTHIASLRASRVYNSAHTVSREASNLPIAHRLPFVPPYPFSSPIRPPSSARQKVVGQRPRASTPGFKREVSAAPSFVMRPPFLQVSTARRSTPVHDTPMVKRPPTPSRMQNQLLNTPPRPSFDPRLPGGLKYEPYVEGDVHQTQLQFFRRTGKFSPKQYGSPVASLKLEDEGDEDTYTLRYPSPAAKIPVKPYRSPPTPQSHSGRMTLSNAARTTPAATETVQKALRPAPQSLDFASEPPTVRKRKRLNGVAAAYDFGRPEEDEEWSTLAATKKLRKDLNGGSSSANSTGFFQIPGLINPLPEGRKSGMSATSQRRVIKFLPPPLLTAKPPLVPASAVHPSGSSVGADVTGFEPGAIDRYPTPHRPRTKVAPYERRNKPTAAQPSKESPKVKNDPIDHDPRKRLSRLPSPPTSDDRVANEECSPVTAALSAINPSTLRERYHQHRGKVRS